MAAFPIVKLAGCVDLLAGFAFKSQGFSDNLDDIPLVKGENVSQGRILWDISKRWPVADWPNLEKFQLRTGDVVVAMDRPWVPAGLKWACIRNNDPKALLVQRCARLRSKTPKLDQNFLRFVIGGPAFESYVIPITTGVNVPHISGKQILDYEFALPPLPVQQRIVDILSAYDELIENNQRRIKILESMARSLYREWFVHYKFPEHEFIPLESSPLGDIPRGWEVKKLGDLIAYNRRATKPGPLLEERRYVPIDCMPPKSLALLEARPIEEAKSSLQLFDKGDILFGAMRPYFHKVVVAPFPGVTRTTCFVFKPVRPEWHAFATMTAFDGTTVAYANAHSQGATIPYAVWDGSLSEMPLVLPSTEVLQRFEALVAPILSRLALSFFEMGNLRRTRDLLLPRLLSGDINVELL